MHSNSELFYLIPPFHCIGRQRSRRGRGNGQQETTQRRGRRRVQGVRARSQRH